MMMKDTTGSDVAASFAASASYPLTAAAAPAACAASSLSTPLPPLPSPSLPSLSSMFSSPARRDISLSSINAMVQYEMMLLSSSSSAAAATALSSSQRYLGSSTSDDFLARLLWMRRVEASSSAPPPPQAMVPSSYLSQDDEYRKALVAMSLQHATGGVLGNLHADYSFARSSPSTSQPVSSMSSLFNTFDVLAKSRIGTGQRLQHFQSLSANTDANGMLEKILLEQQELHHHHRHHQQLDHHHHYHKVQQQQEERSPIHIPIGDPVIQQNDSMKLSSVRLDPSSPLSSSSSSSSSSSYPSKFTCAATPACGSATKTKTTHSNTSNEPRKAWTTNNKKNDGKESTRSDINTSTNDTISTKRQKPLSLVSLPKQSPSLLPSSSRRKDSKWMEQFDELVAYKNEQGDTLVPRGYRSNPKLASWVAEQRKQYKLRKDGKPSCITHERIAMLDGIGFAWNAQEAAWHRQVESLMAFRAEHGHSNVPVNEAKYPKLGLWVKEQRRHYTLWKQGRPSHMTEDRVKELTLLGFCWDTHENTWLQRLEELAAYKRQYGDCLVPTAYPHNPKLGTWVHHQRRQYKRFMDNKDCHITPDRIEALERLGFTWNPRDGATAPTLTTPTVNNCNTTVVMGRNEAGIGSLKRKNQSTIDDLLSAASASDTSSVCSSSESSERCVGDLDLRPLKRKRSL